MSIFLYKFSICEHNIFENANKKIIGGIQMNLTKKTASIFLCVILSISSVLAFTACGKNNSNNNTGNNGNSSYNPGNNQSGSSNSGNSQGNNNSTGSDGKTSSDIGEVLNKEGFTQEYSNVYVYTDGGTYYGEIITQPDVSIIYIKQRNEGFDARIKGVLAQLLPESCNQVWNNYVSATTDRTFTVEDRKVRIVTASRGGHSQIVIYN